MNRFSGCVVSGAVLLFAVIGCGGGSGSGNSNVPAPADSGPAALVIHVSDVTGIPISGAEITVSGKAVTRQTVTGMDGTAEVYDLPPGEELSISVAAEGFDPASGTEQTVGDRLTHTYWQLQADHAWAVGRTIVLGTRVVERSGDTSSMTFSVDLAVVGENSESLDTLTASQFSVVGGGCGWGHRISCAYGAEDDPGAADFDADNGARAFHADEGPQAFEWVPSAARKPYVVGVLVERTSSVAQQISALKSFFAALGGNDLAGLASLPAAEGEETFAVLAPFTNDGSLLVAATDDLADPAEGSPDLVPSLTEYVRAVAEADAPAGAERTVLAMVRGGDLVQRDFSEPTALALALGVRVSYLGVFDLFGAREVAGRSGGFVSVVTDPRHYGPLLGAMDALLAGSLSFYRIQFRIDGEAGTFESGRTATLLIHIAVPTTFPSNGVEAPIDIFIP